MYQRIILLHVNDSIQVIFAAMYLFGDNILTWQHFFFIEKRVICFSYKLCDFVYLGDFVTKIWYAVTQFLLV